MSSVHKEIYFIASNTNYLLQTSGQSYIIIYNVLIFKKYVFLAGFVFEQKVLYFAISVDA